jgi:hypothetical protein
MRYECGTEVMLGDVIMVGCGPDQETLARIVAIGTDFVIDGIDQEFYSWAKSEGIINEETVVIEWLGVNPLEHNDLNYAPVGNYMTLQSLCCERFVRRGSALPA